MPLADPDDPAAPAARELFREAGHVVAALTAQHAEPRVPPSHFLRRATLQDQAQMTMAVYLVLQMVLRDKCGYHPSVLPHYVKSLGLRCAAVAEGLA